MSDTGWIVLRDVPKDEAKLGLTSYPIESGFRGFKQVPPGLHHVSVLWHGRHWGVFTYVYQDQADVWRFDPSPPRFLADWAHARRPFEQTAKAGSMDHVLLPYAQERHAEWLRLSGHVESRYFLMELGDGAREREPLEGLTETERRLWFEKPRSRFDLAFRRTHLGVYDSFLTELQLAFLRWFFATEDRGALARWTYLVQAIYEAGEHEVRTHPGLFVHIADALLAQFERVPQEWLWSDGSVGSGASRLWKDLEGSRVPGAVEAGRRFRQFFEARGCGPDGA